MVIQFVLEAALLLRVGGHERLAPAVFRLLRVMLSKKSAQNAKIVGSGQVKGRKSDFSTSCKRSLACKQCISPGRVICLCEEIERHLPRTVDLDVFGAKKQQDKLLSQLTKPAMLLDVQKSFSLCWSLFRYRSLQKRTVGQGIFTK